MKSKGSQIIMENSKDQKLQELMGILGRLNDEERQNFLKKFKEFSEMTPDERNQHINRRGDVIAKLRRDAEQKMSDFPTFEKLFPDAENYVLKNENLGLNKTESSYLTAQVIACGDWSSLKINTERAFEIFAMFCEAFVMKHIDGETFVKSIYDNVQNSLLTSQTFTFEVVQQLPPFSEFGRKNFTKLLKLYQEKGIEASKKEFKRIFRKGWEQKKPDQKTIRILSGDGKTIETPIKFSTKDVTKRVRAEYWFIASNYGKEDEDWQRGIHFSVIQPKTYKMISNWSISLSDGRNINVYFDTNRV